MTKKLLKLSSALILLGYCFFPQSLHAQYLYTVAGGGKSTEDIPALNTSVTPNDLTVDAEGNSYFIDLKHHSVRKHDAATGNVNTIAGGNGPGFGGDDGTAIGAKLNDPRGVALSPDGKRLYIADKNNNRIRMVDLITGVITTVAGNGSSGYSGDGGPATEARLSVVGVHVDVSGNLYFADSENNVIRKVDMASGIINTVAGNGLNGNAGDGGAATDATFNSPVSVCTDASGNLYIADPFSNNIRKVDTSGNITTVAGTATSGFSGDGGPAADAQFSSPTIITCDAHGNLYVADRGNRRIRKISTDGVISTIAGNGSTGSFADGVPATDAYTDPIGLAVDIQGDVIIAESSYVIRKVTSSSGIINTIIGNRSSGYEGDGGPATLAQLSNPSAVFKHTDGNIYIADYLNSCIRKVDAVTSSITTIAGNGKEGFSMDGTLASEAQFRSPIDVAVDAGNNIYVVERSTNRIRKIDAATGKLSTVAGTGADGFSGDGGLATSATLSNPLGICIDPDGNIFISDNNRIRKIDAVTKKISTVAGAGPYGFGGDGGPATSALLYIPSRLASDQHGNIYFSDRYNHRIRKIDKATGIISTVAGSGTAGFFGDGGLATGSQLNYPLGVTVDASGNIYIADTQNNQIRKVDAATGNISTVSGNGSTTATADGILAVESSLDSPEGVSVDSEGQLYIAVTDNDFVKVMKSKGALITFPKTVSVYSGSPVNLEVTTDPASISLTVTYNGSSSVPVNAGTYEIHAVSNDQQFKGSAWTTLTITKAPQTITFESPGPKALPDGGFDLDAIASSSLPVADPDIATVDGTHVTLIATGTTVITASQAGDENHLPAESIQQTLEVVQESKVIAISGSLEFGDVPVDDGVLKKITIANNGTGTLNITDIALPEGYTADIVSGQVAPGAGLEITITFLPAEEISYTGKLVIASDATSGVNRIDISGMGVTVTGVQNELGNIRRVEVYPNPSNGVFYLKSKFTNIKKVQIMDVTGRIVDSVTITPENENEYQVDISHLQNDSYILFIPATREVARILKQ